MMQLYDSQDGNVHIDSCDEKFSQFLIFDGNQWLYLQKYNNLTPSERQIAELICKGLDEKYIAKNMNIKSGTVKTHTRNIYRKMRVKSKIAMLLKFISEIQERAIKDKSS
jgi:DNA-binding NarL/FixJ family response regulator